MAAGDKYIINYFLGDSANGIYSLALKIPQIINMVYSLFIQAWQMSAIEVESSEDKKDFIKMFSMLRHLEWYLLQLELLCLLSRFM